MLGKDSSGLVWKLTQLGFPSAQAVQDPLVGDDGRQGERLLFILQELVKLRGWRLDTNPRQTSVLGGFHVTSMR